MDFVQFQGNDRDLDRFAGDVLKGSVAIDELSPFERRMSWGLMGSSGFSSATTLRSGIYVPDGTVGTEGERTSSGSVARFFPAIKGNVGWAF